MRDLSLHILDLAQNSVRANAALVEIMVSVDESRLITITIRDDGSGMSDELKERVTSPFATTRTTRKVGLGIPLMMQNARLAGGDVRIDSTLGQGNVPLNEPEITAWMLSAIQKEIEPIFGGVIL